MTRDEFMKHARDEIERAFLGQRNRMMNLVEQAWAEGKKNAEVSGIEDVVKEAIDKIYQQTETQELVVPDIHFDHMLQWSLNTDIPSACQTCANHPSNGGSGICHCLMGIQQIK